MEERKVRTVLSYGLLMLMACSFACHKTKQTPQSSVLGRSASKSIVGQLAPPNDMGAMFETEVIYGVYAVLRSHGLCSVVPLIDTGQSLPSFNDEERACLLKYAPSLIEDLKSLLKSRYIIQTHQTAVGKAFSDLSKDDVIFVTYSRRDDIPISYSTKKYPWIFLQSESLKLSRYKRRAK